VEKWWSLQACPMRSNSSLSKNTVNGRVTTREILQVRFSQLEDTELG
jgi:hypothetical protein